MELKTTEAALDFVLRERIGGGGEGTVYEAHDPQLDGIIAIKKIPKSNFDDENKYFHESQKLYATEHQNVVPIKYGCRDDENIYLAMPLYKNGSIKKIIDERFLTSREIVRYSTQFLSGLNHIHSKGLVHFDIKAENVLINDADIACISDFGLARYVRDYGFAIVEGTTEPFAPPELYTQDEHNLKFDVYQAGLTMYRMCNGDSTLENQFKSAFVSRGVVKGENFVNNLLRGKYPNRSHYLPHIPNKLKKVINTALNVHPNDRYDSVIDMLNDLNNIETVNDWQYSLTETSEVWTKGDSHSVTVTEASGFFSILATKNSRKNRTYCKKVSLSQKNALLYNCLNNEW